MRILRAAMLTTVALTAIGVGDARAFTLMVDGSIEAHVTDGVWCEPTITLEIRSPDPLPFTGDKIPVRRIVGILQQILQVDCPAAQALEILGVVVDAPVYAGTASLADGTLVDGPVPTPADRVPLEREDQVRAIQLLLAELGFDPGPADGAAGRRTKAAIAAFRAERGLAGGETIDLALLRTLRDAGGVGSAAAATAAPVDPSMLRFADYAHYTDQEEPTPSARAFARRLALAALRRDPHLLDSRAAILKWFEADNPYLGVAPKTALRLRWDDANAVERDAILDQYRVDLLAEAATVTPPTAEQPWRFALVHRAAAAGYRPGGGLDLTVASGEPYDRRVVQLDATYLPGVLSATAPALPDISVLPTADDAATSALMDRMDAEGALIVAWLAIEKVGVDDVLGAVVTPSGNDIPMTVRVEAVTLNARAAIVDFYPVPGEMLGAFPMGGSAPQGGAEAVEAAARMGIPVFDGHVALLDTSFAMGDITGAGSFDAPYRLARDRFLYLAGYQAAPPEPLIQEDIDYIGRSILDASQFARVFGTGYQTSFDDEFEERRGLRVLREEVMPEILTDAARFPMPVVSVRALSLGDYDFDTQSFALENPQSGDEVIRLDIRLIPRIRVDYLQPFPPLAMPEAAARDLLARREHANRRIYIAAYGDLRVLAAPTDTEELAFDPRRLVLYADEGLTEILAEYDVSAFIPPATDAPKTLTEEERRAQAYAAAEAETGLSVAGLATVADRLLPGTGFLDAYLRTAGRVRDADEFAREALMAETARTVAAEAPSSETFILPGTLTLGEYDVEAGTFAAREIALGSAYSEAGYFGGEVTPLVRNLDTLAALRVERSQAEAAVAQVRNRTYQIRAEVRAIVADADLSRAGVPKARVGLEVVRLDILVPRANGGGAFVIAVDVAPQTAAVDRAIVALPDRLMLTPDVAQLLAVRAMQRPIPDAALRTLYLNRYVFETRLGTPVAARFFGDVPPPDNLSYTQDAARFADWLEKVAAALPDRYTLVWDLAPPGANPDSCARARVEDAPPAYEEARRLGVMAAPSWVEGVALELALPPSGGTTGCYDDAAGRIGDELNVEEHYWLSQRVLLDRLPVYDFAWSSGQNIELDLLLERVEIEATEGSFPNVRLYGRTEQGRVVSSADRGADGIVDEGPSAPVATFEPPPAAAGSAGKTPAASSTAGTSIDDLLLAELQEAPLPAAPQSLVLVTDHALDDSVSGFALSTGGRLALVGTSDSLVVWDMKKGVVVRELMDHGGYASEIAWSPDGRRALVVHEDAVRLWDIGSASVVTTFPREGFSAVAFAPDGGSFYAAGDNGVEERSIRDGTPIRRLGEGTFSLSSDGLLLAVFTTLGAEIVETAKGTAIRRFAFDAWPVSAAFSPDGARVAFGLADGRIVVHDVATGTVVAALEGHRADVTGLAFADARRLVSASEDGTIRVWDVDVAREIGEGLHARDTLIGGPYVAADGLSAITTHYGLKRWTLPAP